MWRRNQAIISNLLQCEKLHDGVADKAACNFAASMASAYRLSTRKITSLDQKSELPSLDHLLRHKRRLKNDGMRAVNQHAERK
jgi:hypothetical protein